MSKLNIGGVVEEVITSEEFTLEKARKTLKDEVVAIIGYGVQGRGQALNLRDNGINVIVGEEYNTKKAIEEGWVPGKNLFSLMEAAKRGTILQYLMSDAQQKSMWPELKPNLTKGKALYFSHGFSIVYKEQTGVIPPADIDVILVAPKGAGRTVRDNYLAGSGINSSYAVFQDATGRALERTLAVGVAIGSGYLFPTSFEHEVWSDLTGERGVLMGCLAGVLEAQYNELRKHGHSPSEAFNETVEELTQSLMPLVAENGMDWMYANCSTTAQRGALDWWKKFRDAVAPVFDELYDNVAKGIEAQKSIDSNSKPDYREKLELELKDLRESELWKTGAQVRKLRPGKK